MTISKFKAQSRQNDKVLGYIFQSKDFLDHYDKLTRRCVREVMVDTTDVANRKLSGISTLMTVLRLTLDLRLNKTAREEFLPSNC